MTGNRPVRKNADQRVRTAAPRPVLLVNSGLLARYDRLDLLDRLREACGRPSSGAPGFLVLVASDEQASLPRLDGKAIPLVTSSDWARIPDGWLQNMHRGGSSLPPAAAVS